MDVNSLNRKYSYLIDRIKKLQEYHDIYDKEKDKIKKEIAYFALQRITEEVVETGIKINIFILKEINIFPKTYQESFLKLNEVFKISEEDMDKLTKSAKFRNLLAHEYIDLDEKEFIKRSKEILVIYPKYLKLIYNKIKNKEK